MELEKLSIRRFRNLEDLDLLPGPGMNVIYGENAQGKTNLLEAVYLLSTLRSFRTRNLVETFRFGEAGSTVEGNIHTVHGKHQLSVNVEKAAKHAFLDRQKVDSLGYLGVLNVFLFSYPLLEVVRGGPEERRKFIDRSIAMSRPAYLPVLMQYHRALKQKTALLAMLQKGEPGKKEGLRSLHAFNQQLLEHGLEIVEYRKAYLNQLQELLLKKQHLFFDNDIRLGLELSSNFLASRQELEQKLDEAMNREIARGACLFGVHRDEIRMMLNGKELRKYGSSGQHRAFLLLLLLAQLDLYEQLREDRPVLLLDDLDSELDQRRIQSFFHEIKDRYQTLISSSRRELFQGNGKMRFFGIQSGRVLEM
ncbi:MAG TPA: DNA replication and repair protein RecF [Acidobacteriota bacterium]|nr:DNA replication and repair protein RecF [Acidobacteriota bacterium]